LILKASQKKAKKFANSDDKEMTSYIIKSRYKKLDYKEISSFL
jgi:hypothetical protein